MQSPIKKVLAWGVHLFTASGLLTGFFALLAVAEHRWQAAAFWLLLSLVIDGVDGTLARWVRVWEVLPGVSGKTIDAVIDFVNYAVIPAYFIYESGLLPLGWELAGVAVILLVSALYYGIEGMVSDDYYFVGFPVLWNLAAFYLFFIMLASPWVNLLIILVLAGMHFVPIKFLYPSQVPTFRWLHLSVAAICLIDIGWIIFRYPALDVPARWIAVAGAVYFGLHALWTTWRTSARRTADR